MSRRRRHEATHRLSLTVTASVYEQVGTLATQERVSMSEWVARLIDERLWKEEQRGRAVRRATDSR